MPGSSIMRVKDAYDVWNSIIERIRSLEDDLRETERELSRVLEEETDARVSLISAAVHNTYWPDKAFAEEVVQLSEVHWPDELASIRENSHIDTHEVKPEVGRTRRRSFDGRIPVPPSRPRKKT